MTTILIIILCCLITGIIVFFITSSKYLKKQEVIKQFNQGLEEQEKQLQLQIKDLEKEYIQKEKNYNDIKNQELISWTQQETELKAQISNLENQIEEKKKAIEQLNTQINSAANIMEAQAYDLTITNLEQQKKELYAEYEKLETELKLHYIDIQDDIWDQFMQQDEKLENQILQKENELNELCSKAKAALESNKRAALEKQQKDFYRLQLDDIDLEEIERIRSIEPYLRKKEPLNKVIWKVYYEKPCTDLIGRVVGAGRKTGIYKITNIENGMCYIGQAVDIAERWKQHIKRGIGADPPTQNKLYPAMLSIGVENFMFEIIEECSGNVLNEREDYWQNFYDAKEWGYSIK